MAWENIPAWEYYWVVFNFVSVFLLIIVLIVIVKARQDKSSLFQGPFFTICLIQGTHELLMFLTNNFVSRLRKYRLIYYPEREDDTLVMWEYYCMVFIRNNLYLGHILVALNRLSVFIVYSLHLYDKIWTTRNIVVATCFGYLINVIMRTVEAIPPRKWPTWVNNETDVFGIHIDPFINTFDTISEIILSSGTGITCIVCYIVAAYFSSKRVFHSSKYRKEELLLLRIGIFSFFTFVPTVIRSTIGLISLITNNTYLNDITLTYMSVCVEVIFVFQPWIYLITCSSLRNRILHFFCPSRPMKHSDSFTTHTGQTRPVNKLVPVH